MDGADADVEYEYDPNGNMTKDLNKNISSIQYNSLNLPSRITYSDGRMAEYVYSAAGAKLSTTYTNGLTTTGNVYCGNMIYENGTLKQILVDGGYITLNGTTPTYHFYLKDHLGNNRVVASGDGTIEQVNHYYPYGGLMGESTGGDHQRYKYNGKELDRMHGLDWYDYGARYMDGARGQFTTMDPLAEKNPDVTPYHFCHNNPINRIDPDGRDDLFDEKGNFVERTKTGDAVMVMCGGQYQNITEVDFSNNQGTIENIGRHYLAKADKEDFNLTVSSIDAGVPPSAALANTEGTQNYDIYLTNGYVNQTLGNCYNFECVAFHESTHRYDSSTHGGNIGEVNAIMRTAKECPAWNLASTDFIQSQASYAAQSLNKYNGDRESVVKNFNDSGIFMGYAVFETNNNRVSVNNMLEGVTKWGKKR